ncbi:MAG: ferritin-like domain-containing protein, partial [Limisphaerales bacterium]
MIQKWLTYFEQNRTNRNPVPWEKGIHIAPQVAAPLIHSLQKFQLGESGEGRTLKRHAANTGDPVY